MKLPKKGEVLTVEKIKSICIHFGLIELLNKILTDPPPNTLKFDGCSCWFSKWFGVDLLPACLKHDIKYWAGFEGETVERFKADAELSIDIALLVRGTILARVMFIGVRLLGGQIFKQSFSWGFGRQ